MWAVAATLLAATTCTGRPWGTQGSNPHGYKRKDGPHGYRKEATGAATGKWQGNHQSNYMFTGCAVIPPQVLPCPQQQSAVGMELQMIQGGILCQDRRIVLGGSQFHTPPYAEFVRHGRFFMRLEESDKIILHSPIVFFP